MNQLGSWVVPGTTAFNLDATLIALGGYARKVRKVAFTPSASDGP